MVSQKYGSSDPDLRNRRGKGKTKEIADAKMEPVSKHVRTTGQIGGKANLHPTNQNWKKSGPKGSITRSG